MKEWDVFISHASEDKESVALPLAEALMMAGIKVWIDKQEIKLGDSIREKIDQGLSKSRFGIVILSQSFLQKGWPKNELNGLMAIEEGGQKVILPIWHNIDKPTLAQYSPILADRLASRTQDGIPSIVKAIIDVVLYPDSGSPSISQPTVSRRFIDLIESDFDISRVRDFLASHPNILERAIVGGSYGEVIVSPDFAVFTPDFAVGTLISTAGDYEWTLLVLGLASGPLFESDDKPTPELAERIARLEIVLNELLQDRSIAARVLPDLMRPTSRIKRYPGSFRATVDFDGIVITGRRQSLTTSDSERLSAYNDHLRPRNLRIRTYDWLLDTSLTLDKGSLWI